MPEPPDFDVIALRLVTQSTAHTQIAVAEQLRQIWNARGAADRAKLEAAFYGPVDVVHIREADARHLDHALQSLDR